MGAGDAVEVLEDRFPEGRGNIVGYLAATTASHLRKRGKGTVIVAGQPTSMHVWASQEKRAVHPDRLVVVRRAAPGVVDLTIHRPRNSEVENFSHGPIHCWHFEIDNNSGMLAQIDEVGLYKPPFSYSLHPGNPREGRIILGRAATALMETWDCPNANPAIPGNTEALELFNQIAPYHLTPVVYEAVLAAASEAA